MFDMSKVKVGSVLIGKSGYESGVVVTGFKECPYGRAECAGGRHMVIEPGRGLCATAAPGDVWTLRGEDEPAAPTGWEKALPVAPTPRSGWKDWRKGDVWASCWDKPRALVWECLEDVTCTAGSGGKIRVLAHRDYNPNLESLGGGCFIADCAVLLRSSLPVGLRGASLPPGVLDVGPLQHDFSDRYCVVREAAGGPLMQACSACGVRTRVIGVCKPDPRWRARYEEAIAKAVVPLKRREGIRRSEALATLGGCSGPLERDVGGVGALTDGLWDVAPERGR